MKPKIWYTLDHIAGVVCSERTWLRLCRFPPVVIRYFMCISVNLLMVIAISFNDINIKRFTSSKTGPIHYLSSVGSYFFSWTLDSGQPITWNSTTTTTVIRGLQREHSCTVTVTSINSVIQVNSLRTISTSKQPSASEWNWFVLCSFISNALGA